MYSFEIGYMSDKLRVVNGENVELEVFEEVYGECSDVVLENTVFTLKWGEKMSFIIGVLVGFVIGVMCIGVVGGDEL